MRILFLSDRFPPERDATSARVFERARYWVRWGHDVTVVTCAPNHPDGRVFPGYENRWHQTEEMDGIRVRRVKTYIAANRGSVRRTLDFLSFGVSGYFSGARSAAPDVVMATSPQLFTAVAGRALSTRARVPFVMELADLWPASIEALGAFRSRLLLWGAEQLELSLYRTAASIVALTPAFKTDLTRRGIRPEKIAVVMNGADPSMFHPRPPDEELARRLGLHDRFVVGYVGTLGAAHALDNVLDAALFLKGDERVRFMLLGEGAERDPLKRRIEQQNLDNVVLLPPEPKERMPAYWSICSLALVHLKNVPVFSTVIPSKIFEAMAMGMPVLVAAPRGEASRIVEGEGAGIQVEAENPAELARVVSHLADDGERQALYRRNSLSAAPKYSRERQARDVLTVLENTVSSVPF